MANAKQHRAGNGKFSPGVEPATQEGAEKTPTLTPAEPLIGSPEAPGEASDPRAEYYARMRAQDEAQKAEQRAKLKAAARRTGTGSRF